MFISIIPVTLFNIYFFCDIGLSNFDRSINQNYKNFVNKYHNFLIIQVNRVLKNIGQEA